MRLSSPAPISRKPSCRESQNRINHGESDVLALTRPLPCQKSCRPPHWQEKQEEVDKIVLAADHRGTFAECWAMREDHGHAILALCVSDLNKQLLLNSEGFIPLLVDSMFLDLEHPRRDDSPLVTAKTDFDAVAPPVQRVSCKPLLVRMCPSNTADMLTL